MKHDTARSKYGVHCACRYCGQDIEFQGRANGWRDRGNGRQCLPYTDKTKGEIVRPKTKHAPFKG